MGLRVGKVLVLSRVDRIKDSETKKVVQEIIRVIQETNANNYSDLVYLEARIKALE